MVSIKAATDDAGISKSTDVNKTLFMDTEI